MHEEIKTPLSNYSVVIPAYNSADNLREAVDSAVQQTHPPYEIIIIDDGSKDNTGEIIKTLANEISAVRPYTNKVNIGVAETRNRGFSIASSDYIALLDSDDIWLPEKMKKQISFMELNKCDFSYTGYSFIDTQGKPIENTDYFVPKTAEIKEMLKENYIGCATTVISKEIAENYKMSSEYSHEDYVFWLTLLQDKKIGMGINEILVNYRISPDSRSGNKFKAAKNRWKIYRNFLKLSIFKSLYYFMIYAFRGYKKHRS